MQQLPSLKPSQIYILKQLYKFRFVTSKDLATYRKLSDQYSTYRSLEILTKLKYVHKRYQASYRIDRKSAIYSLSKLGISYLREQNTYSLAALHAMYKNSTASELFIDLRISSLKTCAAMNLQYPDTFDLFTAVELIDQDYFPEPRPDLYVRRRDLRLNVSYEYFLYAVNDVQLFIIKKRLKSWLTHFDEEGWDGDYPTILLVCATQSIETRMRAYLVGLELEDELTVLTTTKKALLQSDTNEVWMDYRTDQLLVNLNS